MKDVDRNLGNFASVPGWNTVMNAQEVEYAFDVTGGTIFCNGYLRNLKVEKITDNCFKVSTENSYDAVRA